MTGVQTCALPILIELPWVGLTDEEISKAFHPLHDTALKFARAIEAKLKEKNT